MSITTSPWTAAVDRLSAKTVVGSRLRSAEWQQMPVALRERALFSAGVENVRILDAMKTKLTAAAQQLREGGTLQNKARFVADLRQMLGAAPGDSGELTDLTSRRRLELIWEFQQQDAHAYAAREADLDPELLDAFPAYRLVRIEARRVPREWFARWGTAGAAVRWIGASRTQMVALKTSPIWSALSRFGRPHPPFDYGSGMGLEDVDRDEAEDLQLLPKDQPPAERLQQLRGDAARARQQWNEHLSASVKGISEQGRAWMKQAFGNQIEIQGDRVQWVRAGSSVPVQPAPVAPPAATTAPVPVPEVERVATAVTKAATPAEAHAIMALPEAARGTIRINPTAAARPQVEAAHSFMRSLLHKDMAPAATVKVELHVGRSFYDVQTATAYVRRDDVRVTVHEMAHHLECTNPQIHAECLAFRASRTKPGEKPRPLAEITGNYGFRYSEIAIEDEWVQRGGSAYAGKIYPDALKATEILTVGLERMYLDPVNFARQDPDYFKFILRVLRPKS